MARKPKAATDVPEFPPEEEPIPPAMPEEEPKGQVVPKLVRDKETGEMRPRKRRSKLDTATKKPNMVKVSSELVDGGLEGSYKLAAFMYKRARRGVDFEPYVDQNLKRKSIECAKLAAPDIEIPAGWAALLYASLTIIGAITVAEMVARNPAMGQALIDYQKAQNGELRRPDAGQESPATGSPSGLPGGAAPPGGGDAGLGQDLVS